ncbi:CHAT domain-containing protein [Propioniciclava soli]|uniref:CHAT domain-containing protein n=1 Tax=Propioniciclava soli TaxID=2775081 RepID=UPI001E55AD12|nr:CHAT domain-containing protein [Propioniciclava soli]
MLGAAELHARARTATNAGHHTRACSWARQGLERHPTPVERALLLTTLAYAEAELGHLDLADGLCRDALALAGVDDHTRGTAHGQRAVVLLRLGLPSDALAEFSSAIRTLAADDEALGRNLLNRGNLRLEAADARRALVDFERAAAHAERTGNASLLAKARHNAGYAAFLLGDHVRALTAMDSVASFFAGQAPALHAVWLQDRAEVLAAAGLRDDAVADLRRAIDQFRAGRARRAAASAELLLARLVVTDDPAEGLRLARHAASRFAAMGADLSRLRADAAAAVCACAAGRRRLPDVERLLAELRARGLADEARRLAIAWCGWLLAQGRLTEARRVPLPPSTPRRYEPWAAAVAAQRQIALGRRADALRTLRTTLDGVQALASTLGSLELQTSLSGALTRLGQLGLSVALARPDVDLVLEWSERTRAASSRVVGVRPPTDAAQADDLTELRALHAFGGDPARQRELRRRIRERAWQAGGSGATQPVATRDELGAALAAADATSVCLFVSDAELDAVVVDGAGGGTLVRLGPLGGLASELAGLRADLDVAAADLPAPFAPRVRAGLVQRLAQLDATWLAPALARVTTRRVVLVTPGLFSLVPWPLLPSLRDRAVTVPRSATAWARPPARRALTRPLLVAGPSLRRAADEVGACATHWGDPEVLTGPDATVEAVGTATLRSDVVHVAAHGHHHALNPLFSHVDLADGPAFGYELDRLVTLPDTVVLSACELGAVGAGDDPLGLATALLHAGVRTVLASPVALSDDAAARLMPDLHARLASGSPPADALAASVAAFGPDAPPLVCFGAGW